MKLPNTIKPLSCLTLILLLFSSMPVSSQSVFESDWIQVGLDDYTYLTHNLGGNADDYLVFMYGKNFYGIHQANYGLAEKDLCWYGVEWLELNPSTITLYRGMCDTEFQVGEDKWWEWVKVIIIRADCISSGKPCGEHDIELWSRDGSIQSTIPILSFYDSDWFTIQPDQCLLKNHSLGGDPGEYLIFVNGRNGYGIHQARFGMVEASGSWIGLHWSQLNTSTMRICRAPDDDVSGHMGPWDEVRIKIIKTDMDQINPSYDSQWFSIDPDEDIDLPHNLGITPGRYLVFLKGKNSYGIHNANYGTLEAPVGFFSRWFGAQWYQLNEDRITVRRAAGDGNDIAPSSRWNQARVLIIGDIWEPCANVELTEGAAKTILLTSSPNPFHGMTEVRFYVPMESRVEIDVYNITGRHIRTLLNESCGPGWQNANWDGRDIYGHPVSSGNYFVRLKTDEQEEVHSLILIH